MEKPDYVLNFVRPANTEIKFIRGHWYLYERHSVYDPQLGRSIFVKGHVPASPFGYEEAFSFHGRGIHSLTIPEEGFHIHLFLDTDLLAQEISDVTKRTEKLNAAIGRRKEQELKRRRKGKGRLTDEELESLEPLTVREAYADKEEMGTITLKIIKGMEDTSHQKDMAFISDIAWMSWSRDHSQSWQ